MTVASDWRFAGAVCLVRSLRLSVWTRVILCMLSFLLLQSRFPRKVHAERSVDAVSQRTVFAGGPLRLLDATWTTGGGGRRAVAFLHSKAFASSSSSTSTTKLFGNCCAAAKYFREMRNGEGSAGEFASSEGEKPATPRVGESSAGPRPSWFHVPAPKPGASRFNLLKDQIRSLKLHTVCEEAKCPNIAECWEGGTATLMLMDVCEECRFCAIKTSNKPPPLDPLEPEKVTDAVSKWSIDYLVLTSVDRDDLPDGGAGHFARTVQLLKKAKPEMFVECLVPDFQGNLDSVRQLALSGLDVYAHNIETVRRLTPFVRDRRATFDQSLFVLREAKRMNPSLFTKSSIILGLGETRTEVEDTLKALRENDVDAVTMGQYLRPSKSQLGIVRFVTPPEFAEFRDFAQALGFKYVVSAPLSRSSYRAGEFYLKTLLKRQRAKLKADVPGLRGSETEIAD